MEREAEPRQVVIEFTYDTATYDPARQPRRARIRDEFQRQRALSGDHMRMIEGRRRADAHEFFRADADRRQAEIILEMRDRVDGHRTLLKQVKSQTR